jgi:hypothetical protein
MLLLLSRIQLVKSFWKSELPIFCEPHHPISACHKSLGFDGPQCPKKQPPAICTCNLVQSVNNGVKPSGITPMAPILQSRVIQSLSLLELPSTSHRTTRRDLPRNRLPSVKFTFLNQTAGRRAPPPSPSKPCDYFARTSTSRRVITSAHTPNLYADEIGLFSEVPENPCCR